MNNNEDILGSHVGNKNREAFLSNPLTRVRVSFFPALVQRFSRPLLKFLCWFFLRWEVVGQENLKNIKGGVIFASNHVHELDSFMVGAALPWFSKKIPLYYVSRSREYRPERNRFVSAVYGSWIFPLMGAIAIDSGLKDYARSLWRHEELLRIGKSVCIFPEGRIVRPGNEVKVHGGLGYLLEATDLPVIPVRIEGVDSTMTAAEFFLRKRKLKITIGNPLKFEDLIPVGYSSQRDYYYRISKRVVDSIYNLK